MFVCMFALKLKQYILCMREGSGITCACEFPNSLVYVQAQAMAYVCRILGENCRRFSRQTYVFVGFVSVSWYVSIWGCMLSWISKANFTDCHCYSSDSQLLRLHVVCTSWNCNCSCSILFTFVHEHSRTVDVILQYWIYAF